MSTIITDAHHLAVVPDGTIVSWFRIPGDRTSEAVAFIRREVDHDTPTAHGGPTVTVWVSPGGWEPQSIESAGVTFPAHVVRWGEVDATAYAGAELPAVVETLAVGGTWGRDTALAAASRVCAGHIDPNLAGDVVAELADTVLDVAARFLAWLAPEDCGLGQ